MNSSFLKGFEKAAVDLAGLRRATKGIMKNVFRNKRNIVSQEGNTVRAGLASFKQQVPDGATAVPMSAVPVKGAMGKTKEFTDRMLKLHDQTMPDIKIDPRLRGKIVGSDGAKVVKAIDKDVRGMGGPKDYLRKDYKKLDPENREVLNRTFLKHENDEILAGKKNKRLVPISSHQDPSVIFRENNIVATLPKQNEGAKNFMKHLRSGIVGGEGPVLGNDVKGFNYGEKRYSRHAIKRMSEIYREKQLRRLDETLKLKEGIPKFESN